MNHWKTWGSFILLLSVFFLAACAPRPTAPLPVLEYGRIETTGNRTLLILLRGIGGSYADFERYGLIDQVRAKHLPLDIVVPDAHYGYYRNETIVQRLKQDIVAPARARGYRNIWLGGISMGGLGCLFYLREYPEDLSGVMLISPFLGDPPILQEIQQAKGVVNWQPETSRIADWQNLIWGFVHRYAAAPEDFPPVYLGYGTDDARTGAGPGLLAEVLKPENVFTVPGGHDYPTFKTIWAEQLERFEIRLEKQ